MRIGATSVNVEPFSLSCRSAVALALWERHFMQPAALRHFGLACESPGALWQLCLPQRKRWRGWPPQSTRHCGRARRRGIRAKQWPQDTVRTDWNGTPRKCPSFARFTLDVPGIRRGARPRVQRGALRPPASRPRLLQALSVGVRTAQHGRCHVCAHCVELRAGFVKHLVLREEHRVLRLRQCLRIR